MIVEIRLQPLFVHNRSRDDIIHEFIKRYRPLVGTQCIILCSHTLTVCHTERIISNDLNAIIPNPFSVKRFGNSKALKLFEDYIYDNPHLLFDIAVMCEITHGTVLYCDCKHKRCHGEIIVNIATKIETMFRLAIDGEYQHVKIIQASGHRKITIFGKKHNVDCIVDKLQYENQNLIIDNEIKTYGIWKYVYLGIANMFTQLFDVGES